MFQRFINLQCYILKGFLRFFSFVAFSVYSQAEQLIWQDEFSYTGIPDPLKWQYESGYVRNKENQFYTVEDLKTAYVENGFLTIQADRDGYWPSTNLIHSIFSSARKKRYNSASITTKHLPGWKNVRIEVRAKLPKGRGVWPAIWLLGEDINEVGWPACGEIDIMEYVGHKPGIVHSALHSQRYNHLNRNNIKSQIKVSDLAEKFHIFAVDKRHDRIDFWLDDYLYFSYLKEQGSDEAWPFDRGMYLILNLAIGGSWGGQKGIDDNIFPQKFVIDYVRIYEL